MPPLPDGAAIPSGLEPSPLAPAHHATADHAAAPPAVVAELAWAGGRDAVLVDERCGFEAELAPWLARRAAA